MHSLRGTIPLYRARCVPLTMPPVVGIFFIITANSLSLMGKPLADNVLSRLFIQIGSGGRGAESLNKSASDVLYASDQLAEDKSVRALLKTMELQRPLVLLIDDKYTLFPLDLASRNCAYAVLGFYRIARAWGRSIKDVPRFNTEICVIQLRNNLPGVLRSRW